MRQVDCFFVQYKTIDRIIFWIIQIGLRELFVHDKLRKRLHEVGVDTTKSSWQDTLGQKMLTLNAYVMKRRYKDNSEIDYLAARASHYSYIEPKVKPIQSIKSLNCWLCQCSQADRPNKELFNFFSEDIQPAMLRIFVHNLPEYKAAEWE